MNTHGMDHQDWIVQTLEQFEKRLLWYAARLLGQTARYVRLHSHGNTANDQNHYIEVEIWGRNTR